MVLLIEKNFYRNFVTDLVPMKTLYLTIQEELNKIVSYYIFFSFFYSIIIYERRKII